MIFTSLSQLRALPGAALAHGETIAYSNYANATGQKRFYVWNSTSADSDDGEVTIKLADTATGRLKLFGAFLQSRTGATARSMLVKARETVSVTDFGAVGVETETAKFQSAIDSFASDNGHYQILVPSGAYTAGSARSAPETWTAARSRRKGRILEITVQGGIVVAGLSSGGATKLLRKLQ